MFAPDVVNSWVGPGSNKPYRRMSLRSPGSDHTDMLTAQTGMLRDELLQRLSWETPKRWTSSRPRTVCRLSRKPLDGCEPIARPARSFRSDATEGESRWLS